MLASYGIMPMSEQSRSLKMPPLWQPKKSNIKPLWTSWYIQPQQYFFLPHTNLHNNILLLLKSLLPNRKNKIKRSIKVLVVNRRSIVDKKKEYENLIHSTKPDVIGTESWLKPKHFDNEIFSAYQGYTPFRRERVGQNGGGVFIAVRNDIVVQEMKDIQSDCEDVWIKIDLFGSKSLQTPWTWQT